MLRGDKEVHKCSWEIRRFVSAPGRFKEVHKCSGEIQGGS